MITEPSFTLPQESKTCPRDSLESPNFSYFFNKTKLFYLKEDHREPIFLINSELSPIFHYCQLL